MRLPEPQGLVLFLQISVLSLWFFFSLCGVLSGQTDGWARANACGKLSGNGVDLSRKRGSVKLALRNCDAAEATRERRRRERGERWK